MNSKRDAYQKVREESLKANAHSLPPSLNPDICVQKSPTSIKVSMLKVAMVVLAIVFGFLCIYYISAIFYRPSLKYVIFAILMGIMTILVPASMWSKVKDADYINKNYQAYLKEIGASSIISIEGLAEAVNQELEETINDLEEMIARGYFKEARIVDNKILIIDDKTYRMYLKEINA